MEIAARITGTGVFFPLSPRQPITATPYAITASNLTGAVAASQLTGTISSNNISAGTITTVMLATGAVGSNQLVDGAVTAPKVATVSNWFALTIANPTPMAVDSSAPRRWRWGATACSLARIVTTRARWMPGRRICSAPTARC